LKIVYIAGPYRGKTDDEVYENIQQARRYTKKYLQQGYAVFCPHLNTAFFSGVVHEDHFIQMGLEILSRCDILVLIPGWIASGGSQTERRFAFANNIEIIEDKENL